MQSTINYGDTAWILVSTALVLLMTAPGLALFYGGLVRRKNVLSTMMQSFFILCIISIQWLLWGYSLAFGPDVGHIFGNLAWFGLKGVGLTPNPDYAATIPHQLFMVFQMMFAVITPALITGAFAERIKFSTFVVFTLLWATVVYDPIAHWVWGKDGWLHNLGALDFAGGTVVHMSSGYLGARRRAGHGQENGVPADHPAAAQHDLHPDWARRCSGSAGSGSTREARWRPTSWRCRAFINTNTAAAAAAIGWVVIDWIVNRKPTVLGAATGAVAGLVAITPGSGLRIADVVHRIGLIVAIVCYIAVAVIKQTLGYDDSLDAFGVHGVGGTVGALATGLFAAEVHQLGRRRRAVLRQPAPVRSSTPSAAGATIVYAVVVTFIIAKVLDLIMGLRVKEQDEAIGLDNTQHKESAYTLID